MSITKSGHWHTYVSFLVVLILAVFALPALPAFSESGNREVNGGPYSLTVRGGAESDSAALGLDGRLDLLNPLLNFHAFATYDQVEASSGIGAVDTQRYGVGLAISHTYPGVANVFVGTAVINELNEYFGHAYIGGKLKVRHNALVSGSYGFGLGPDKEVTKKLTRFLTAESVDWGKVGVTLVGLNGSKANVNYYLTDPGGENISGLEGELSHPVTDNITLGVSGGSDLSDKSDIDRSWRGFLFLAYSFGSQRGSVIDLALDKNSPVAYPHVIRKTGPRTAAATTTAATPLSISPMSPTADGCATPPGVTFTASGGTAPYSFTTSGTASNLAVLNATQAQWEDNADDFCSSGGTVTVTVTDSSSNTATATITVNAPPA